LKKEKRNTKGIKNAKCQMPAARQGRPNGGIFRNIFNKIIIPSFLICSFVICHSSFALAKEYDGIWFMGMNLRNDLFKSLDVRKAVNLAIDKESIVSKIVSAESTPLSIIPPGMLGYDPDLTYPVEGLKEAKALMRKAGYPMNDQRLKSLKLLHTDGVKTVAIAQQIQDDLKNIGMKVELVEVSYKDEEKWASELASGKYDFFLMGYKAGIEQLFATEEASVMVDSYNLIEPLFKTGGQANFTGYSNAEVDKRLKQLSGLDMALKSERHKKLKEINQMLFEDHPIVVLFYIEKL
jgi:ABC-type transport system substrate-binding protein